MDPVPKVPEANINVIKKMPKLIRDRYLWYMVISLSIVIIFTYTVEARLLSSSSEWHSISVAIRNFLLLGIVSIGSWKFGFKRGLIACLAISLISLPHIVNETLVGEYNLWAFLEYMIFIPTGVVLSWLWGTRKQIEETLKLQAELLDKELDSVYLHDLMGNFFYVNKAAYLTHGYTREELLNMKISQLDDPESAKLIAPRMKEIAEKGEATFEVNHLHKNGSLIPLEIHASKIEVGGKQLVMSIAHEITGRRKVQQQLMAQDRLASIGQMVSGVAHEINNPLTSVIGFSELLLQRDLPEDVKADLKIVNDEAKRTALIVKSMLTFARKQPEGKEPIDINDNIRGVLKLRSHEQRVNNIQVNEHFAPDLPQIMGNNSQLQQVFFNIVTNAEQAMLEAHNRGALNITTEQVGDTVIASFADDGPGISPENMKLLFTPFFTTKGVGKGTGLGLSICHGIITEHGGKIHAESEPGKGITFIVELPVYNKSPQQEKVSERQTSQILMEVLK